MESKGLFNVVRKEFIDHLTSRKFLIILALFLIISMYSMHAGIGEYNEALENYKERISQIEAEEGPGPQVMPKKPSILLVFQIIYEIMPLLGAILAIAMGFDLVTKEKESRSLKSLLSHPVYRDEIINGKALGGILALVFAVGIAFILLFAMLLIFSIVPNMGEFARIALFGAVTVLCLLSYFSIALMTSTISENSGKSFIYALIIFFAITLFVPMVGDMVAESVAGERPELPDVPQYESEISSPSSANENEPGEPMVVPLKRMPENEEWQRYAEENYAYWEKRRAIRDAYQVIQPDRNFNKFSRAVINPYTSGETSILKSLERVWKNIFALIIFPIVFFAIAYIKFMRMDIR
ncbi:MAG TPA: ABC transporter permease [Methanophagales archaeon]|nr:ABC transporter permease [Methanophagales archaeon]